MTAILFKIAGAGACCDVSVYQGIISGVNEETLNTVMWNMIFGLKTNNKIHEIQYSNLAPCNL